MRATLAATVLGVLISLVIACGGDAGPAVTSLPVASPFPATASPAAAASCDPARPHQPGSFDETITSGGRERTYILHIPSSYTGEQAMPLVLSFHGFASRAERQASYSRLPAKGEEAGFIVVTPQGTGAPSFWNLGQADAPDDVAFVADLLDGLEASLCIDTARIYSAGMSNGAAFSVLLACLLPERIAAVAPVTATFFCPSARPVPVIAFHGTDDPIVPFEGGPLGAGLDSSFDVDLQSIEEAVAGWGEHNGCASPPERQPVSENVTRVRYEECTQGAAVELYIVLGGGHTWPGADPALSLGPTTQEIDATDLIWDFFLAHPLP